MKFIKNQKGVSLVEALIGISITAAAGVAYMTHTQNVAKNEAKQKVRGSIDILNAQAVDYLKSRDVCNGNLEKAFGNVPLNSVNVNGDPDYKALKNKGFKDAQGNTQSKDIFAVGDVFDGGKIYISDVSYKLSELTTINQISSPWTRSGKIQIAVEMETCKDGGPVVFKNNGVIQDRCPVNLRTKTRKVYDKLAAFRTNSAGIITDSPIREKKMNSAGQMQWVTTGTKKDLACADSQDALVDAAAQYTDIKVCINEVKMLLIANKEGSTECGIEVKASPASQEFTSSGNITLPKFIYSDGSSIELIGGGAGGGHKNNNKGGHGGKAGKVRKFSFKDLASLNGGQCNIVVAGRVTEGKSGQETSIRCGSATLKAEGGAFVGGDTDSECGGNGENAVDPSTGDVVGVGTAGRCKDDVTPRSPQGFGGGGGGGCGRSERACRYGQDGGPGRVKISYRAVQIIDTNMVLPMAGTTVDELLSSFEVK